MLSMDVHISAMALSSPSDSSVARVVVFLFTVINKEVKREEINLNEHCNGDSYQFYWTLRWASIILAKSIMYDNP